MDRFSSCLALLLIASVIPSYVLGAEEAAAAAASAAPAAERLQLVVYDVGRNLSLLCPLPTDGGAYVWKKNGSAVEELWDLKERYSLDKEGRQFAIKGRSHEDDFGNYSCGAGGAEHGWEVRGNLSVRLAPNTNVVEGQKLTVACRVSGRPRPAVRWSYSNASGDAASAQALGERALVTPDDAGATLVLEAALRSDAGRYWCCAGAVCKPTELRVKDKLAALWPFLGICAEVFVLCAVILLYERRRTSPEQDDSDTDNHDQKKS